MQTINHIHKFHYLGLLGADTYSFTKTRAALTEVRKSMTKYEQTDEIL